MKLVGFNFNKISIERFTDIIENLKINTNIDISEINSVKSDLFKKEELIGVSFANLLNYEPRLAKIELSGNIVLAVEPKLAKEVLNQWKDKKIPEEFKVTLFNLILRKTSIKALQLEEELNLPLHISIPHIKKEESKFEEKR